MATKLSVIASVVIAFVFASASGARAGTDMIIDNSAQAPLPRQYNYAPPPPPRVYYAPPRVSVVVYPRPHYYYAPYRVYGYSRWHGRRVHRPFHHDYWR